jgi:hypothetical protein
MYNILRRLRKLGRGPNRGLYTESMDLLRKTYPPHRGK